MKALINTFIVMVVTSAPAFAAGGTGGEPGGIFVWIFFGFCALIAVAQMVPTLLLLFGIIKGVVSKGAAEEKTHVS